MKDLLDSFRNWVIGVHPNLSLCAGMVLMAVTLIGKRFIRGFEKVSLPLGIIAFLLLLTHYLIIHK